MDFSLKQLATFAAVFALIGGYALWYALAAPNPNLKGDLNNDNTVNVTDLSILLSYWNTNNSAADINLDNTVNITDLSILLSYWGQSYGGGGSTAWPKYGIATGYKILTRTSAMQDWEIGQIKAVGGTIARYDYTSGAQAQGDAVITKLLAQGIEPELVIGGTYHAPGGGTSSLANLASSTATKWKGKVHFYEIMNEPDLNGWTADTYVPYLKAAYSAIKAADPGAIVWHGGMWDCNTANTCMIDWVDREYQLGVKGYFDAFNTHCYGNLNQHGSWQVWDMLYGSGGAGYYDSKNIRSIMNANGDNNVPIVCTEAGENANSHGLTAQADDVTYSLQAVDGIGTGYRKLKTVFIYSLLNDDVVGFGIITPDSAGTLVAPDGSKWTKLPAWTSYYNGVPH